VALAPERAPGWWRLGLWRAELGRFDAAEQAFLRALELDPDDPSAVVGLARLELDDGRAREALERLDALLRRRPLLHAAHLADRARRALGLPPRLPADQVVAPHPWSDPWIDELAELRVGHGEDLAEVLQLVRAGRAEEAVAALEPLLAERPDDTNVQGMYAAACARAGRPEAAVELLRAAAARQPRHYRIALNLSINLAAAGRFEEALVEARRAVELHPGHAMARFQQGRLAQRLGALDEARAAYERALALGLPPERVQPGLEALDRAEVGR
jgi:tetratricopeptide (TPR) repeat protein